MSNLQTALADAGYEMVDADLIELLKAKQAEGTLSAAEAELLSQLEALGIDLEIAEGEALSAEDLQALGDAQASLPSPASAPFASGGLGGLAALGAMGGGSGGGGTAVAAVSSSLQGQLINGYIQGAKVFQDIDGDGEHDEGFEPFSYTDAEGSFALNGYVAGGGELIAATDANTRDVTTDAQVTTEFKLDLDSGFDTSGGVVISPLSTLLAKDPELTEETLKTKLGIASNIDLLTYDPIEAAQTDSDPTAALQFKAVSTQISNLLDIGASTLSTSTGQEKVDVMAGVISSVVEKIKTQDAANIDFADATFLANTIDDAATAVGATADQISAMSSVKTAATQKLEELNDKIEQAVSNPDAALALSEMYKAAKVAQEDLEANIDQVLADPTQLESLLNQFDVDTAVTEVDIPAVNLISNSTFDNAVGWSGDGLGITENGTSLANVAEAGQSYWVNLQYGLPISQGEDYTLTFQARGTEGRALIAGIGLNEDPWTNDTENLTLTEGWKTYTLNLSSASFGSENSRVFFDMGHDVGEVEIDNVSLSLGATEIADPSVDASNYTLVFEDNFDEIGQGPSSDDWTFDLGTGAPNLVGWGNNEVQSYENGLDDAVIVDVDPTDGVNGALQITAQKDGDTITSARVKSALDLDPYGYYEVRAKLPSEAGAWPAIWLLGNDDTWPYAGEIDLVEWSAASNAATATRAENDDTIISALHYPDAHAGSANSTTHTLDTAVDEWHTYQAWWTPDYIAVGVDGTLADAHLVYERPANADNDAWPFDGGMDLIMNIAIGGTLGGTVPADDFSYNMLIDYVKIYQAGTLPESPGPVEETPEETGPTADQILISSTDASEDIEGMFGGVATFGNGATFDFQTAQDPNNAYTRVMQVSSGTGYAADVNVAFAAFQNIGAAFADGYDGFNAKVTATPNGRLEVKLIGTGTDSVADITLADYAGATDLGNGWFDVTIPFTDFSNQDQISAQSGLLIGMPGDNGANAFDFYFTDLSLDVQSAQEPAEETPEETGPTADQILISSTDASEDIEGMFGGVATFGNGATFDFQTAQDPNNAYTRVMQVSSGTGYAADVNVAFAAFQNIGAAFADGYDGFNAKVTATPNGRLEVKLIGTGTDSVADITLADYAGATDLGNGWFDVTIPFTDFSNQDQISAQSGLLIGMPGDNGANAFDFYFTDLSLDVQSAQEPAEETPEETGPTADQILISSTDASEDIEGMFGGVATFGNGATFDFQTAQDPNNAYTRVMQVSSGTGYAADVNVAFAAFQNIGAAFADGYDGFNAKVTATPNGRLEVKLIGTGTDSVADITLADYAGATDLGNGWFDVTIPFTDFSNQDQISAQSGLLIGMPGDNGANAFDFYFTDLSLDVQSAQEPAEETPEETGPTADQILISSTDASEDIEGMFGGVATFGNGATFDFQTAQDPNNAYTRVMQVSSGTGYAADVNVAFAAFQNIGAAFADGYDGFNAKVTATPNGRLEVKLIGTGTDSVADITLADYAGATDLGNGWFDVTIPFTDFSNQDQISAQSGLLIGMPGDNGANAFDFYFTDLSLDVQSAQEPAEETPEETGPTADQILISSTDASEDIEGMFGGVATFGNGATFDFQTAQDPNNAYTRVMQVSSGTGYAADVNVAFAAFQNIGAAFADGYDGFNAKVTATPNGRLEVKLIGTGTDSVADITLADYAGATDLGNGWFDVTIPFTDFSNQDQISAQSGLLIGMPGDNGANAFDFYFTDLSLDVQSAQEPAEETPEETGPTADQILISSTDASEDIEGMFGGVATFGNGATFDFQTAQDPNNAYTRVMQVSSGTGYAADVNVAFAAFQNIGAAFADGYDGFNAKVTATPNGRLEVKLIGTGTDSVADITLADYAGATDLGNGWFDVTIPFTDFSNQDQISAQSGLLIGMPGDNGANAFDFYFTDLSLDVQSAQEPAEETPEETGPTADQILISSTDASEDIEGMFGGVATFGNGATFDFQTAQDPNNAYTRVMQVSSGTGYAADVNVAFAAFQNIGAAFADGYDGFNAKVTATPNGRLEVKLIGTGTDSVADITLADYAGATDLGNGWFDVTIPFTDFSNQDQISAQSGLLIGMPGDNGANAFDFYFTDLSLDVQSAQAPAGESAAQGSVADPSELVITFEADDDSGFALTAFGQNVASVVSGDDAPAGSDGNVVKIVKNNGPTWSGTTFMNLADGAGELITDGYETVSMRVFSPASGVDVVLKLEDRDNPADGSDFVQATQVTQSSDGWETLTWDLSDANHNIEFEKASIFFDFGNAGAGEEYYFDDVTFNGFIS